MVLHAEDIRYNKSLRPISLNTPHFLSHKFALGCCVCGVKKEPSSYMFSVPIYQFTVGDGLHYNNPSLFVRS